MTSRVVPSSNSAVTTSCWSRAPGASDPLGGKDPERPSPWAAMCRSSRPPRRSSRSRVSASIDSRRNRWPPSWETAGRLEDDQAPLGHDRVDAPAELVAGQRAVIEVRVLAAEAEPEAALAAQIAVAGAHVAAGLGEQRDDVGRESSPAASPPHSRPGASASTDRPRNIARMTPSVGPWRDNAAGRDDRERRRAPRPTGSRGSRPGASRPLAERHGELLPRHPGRTTAAGSTVSTGIAAATRSRQADASGQAIS